MAIKSINSFPNAEEIWKGVYMASRNKPNDEITYTPSPLFESEGQRWKLMRQLYEYRKSSRYIYPKDHPSYGTSIFDPFELTKVVDHSGDLAIKFTKRTARGGTIRAGDYELVLDTTQSNNTE